MSVDFVQLGMPREGVMEICDFGGLGWYWAKGHISRDKMRGRALSDGDIDYIDRSDILRAPWHQGWMTVRIAVPEGEFCEPGFEVYNFHDTEVEGGVPVTWLDFGG